MSSKRKIKALATNATWRVSEKLVKRSEDNNVVTVCEFPKSGGTWFAKNIATALNLPFIGNGLFLPLVPCVIRTHWNPDSRLEPTVFVVRDVRDVMVSLFHHRIRNIGNTPKRAQQYLNVFNEPLQKNKIKQQLLEFIKIEFENPRYGASTNWTNHTRNVLSIVKNHEGLISLVKYEDALLHTAKELEKALQSVGKPAEQRVLDLAVELHDSKWGNTRSQYLGETTFLRTAASGNWKEHFTNESAKYIYEHCQDQLLALGYEQCEDWWKEF